MLIYLRTKICVHLWNAFIQQKYHEPLLTIKPSVMKTESLVHTVECVMCAEQWMRVDLQSSFQRCYHWAGLRASSLWHFINWYPFIADSQLVFPIGFDAHYINQTVHIFWWSDLCLMSFTAGSNTSYRGKLLAIFQTTAEILCRVYGGEVYIEYTIECLWRIQLQHQISIKELVTLKIWNNGCWKFSFAITEINYNLKY